MFTFRRIGVGPLVALALLAGCEPPDSPDAAAPAAAPAAQQPDEGRLLSVEIVGAGTVTSQTDGVAITCTRQEDGSQSGPCSAHTTTDDVTLLAAPADGWSFDHWDIARGIDNKYIQSPQNGTLKLTGVGQVSSTYVRAIFTKTTNLTLADFQPTEAPFGADVAISGSGLGGANAIVMFNGKKATVLGTSSDDVLHVLVPAGATTGPIAIQNGSKTVTSTTYFHVGISTANWQVVRPSSPLCFDIVSAIEAHPNNVSNEPDPSNDVDRPAGFSITFPVNTEENSPEDNLYETATGTWNADGSFVATWAGPYPEAQELYTFKGTIAADGSVTGTVEVQWNSIGCDQSGTFTINR